MDSELNDLNLGCFGCLLQVLGVLGLIYIVTHWDAISKLVFGQ